MWADMKSKQLYVGGSVCYGKGCWKCLPAPEEPRNTSRLWQPIRPPDLSMAVFGFGSRARASGAVPTGIQACQGTEVAGRSGLEGRPRARQQRVRAQEWVKHTKTGKSLPYPWVFAGSGFWTDKEAGERYLLCGRG